MMPVSILPRTAERGRRGASGLLQAGFVGTKHRVTATIKDARDDPVAVEGCGVLPWIRSPQPERTTAIAAVLQPLAECDGGNVVNTRCSQRDGYAVRGLTVLGMYPVVGLSALARASVDLRQCVGITAGIKTTVGTLAVLGRDDHPVAGSTARVSRSREG